MKQYPFTIYSCHYIILKGQEYQLSIDYFKEFIMPSLTETDSIFFVTDDFKGY